MKLVLVVLLALAAAVAWFVLRIRRKYAHVFDDDHIRELISLLPRLKAAAFEHLGQPLRAPDDPRIAQTSESVAVFYTAHEARGTSDVLNHLSLSRAGAYLAWAAGGRLAYVMLRQLGVPTDRARFAHSPAGVVHFEFVTPADGRNTFLAEPVSPLPPDLRPLMVEAGAFVGETLRNGRLLRDEHHFAR